MLHWLLENEKATICEVYDSGISLEILPKLLESKILFT